MASLDPPVPIKATFSVGLRQAVITFNHPLLDVPLDPANWSVRDMDLDQPVQTAAVVLPNVVRLVTLGVGPDPGLDGVSFAPPPFDVVSDTAKPTPAPAFTDFPTT